ncbi:MAG: hypothetical protein NTU53_17825 [Planctomycetota bacterium]|nr:hypothetical protein [Planctomycetota bacterium]
MDVCTPAFFILEGDTGLLQERLVLVDAGDRHKHLRPIASVSTHIPQLLGDV